jgi:hypothetical protein
MWWSDKSSVLSIPDGPIDLDDELQDAIPSNVSPKSTLQIVMCITPNASKQISEAEYLQSDIGFKQVIGFYEFEIGSFDRNSNTSKWWLCLPSLPI